MTRLILFSFLYYLILFTGCENRNARTTAGSYHIIGYVLGGNSNVALPADTTRLTHINYAFANVTPQGEVILENEYDSTYIAKLTDLREHQPHLKILLSIGGWVWSDYFSDAALTDSSRNRFASSAGSLLEKHRLDGLDIDWEYPGQPGEDNIYRAEDRENFTLLLQTLREHLDSLSAQDNRPGDDSYLLTIAAGTNDQYLEHTDMTAVQKHLDFVNLMTYDFHGPWTDHTGHHANFNAPAGISDESSATSSVERFIDAGVPKHKIVIGVPFYGRGWTGVDTTNNGLYQSYSKSHGSYSYDSLSNHYINRNGFTRYWDSTAMAPFLWHADSTTFITYEDEESLLHKAEYIKSNGLRGFMYWEHSHNHDEALLKVIDTNLNGN